MLTIDQAKAILEGGGLVGIPTETVYGLGCNALDEQAVRSIYELKGRPSYNPLIAHIGQVSDLHKYGKNVPPLAEKLAEKYWPGPLTLIVNSQSNIPSIVTGGQQTVGLRMPNHPLTLQLLQQVNFPIAAPSANPFQKTSPTSAEHVKQYFGLDFPVLEGGPCEVGIESTILAVEGDEIEILRHGSITIEDLQRDFPQAIISDNTPSGIITPGMSSVHYAPKTKIYYGLSIEEFMMDVKAHHRIAYLNFSGIKKELPAQFVNFEFGNQQADLRPIAQRLYDTFFRIDEHGFDAIFCEELPTDGLGVALIDKIQRAAIK